MGRSRLEAFSDGVIAIIITIMVLDLKQPVGERFTALMPLVPTLLGYVLSFINVGIFWNNHHHMLHLVERVNGAVLWANLHLLFWLSLFPFVTAWMGEHPGAAGPTAAYGVVLLGAALAYWVLQSAIVRLQGPQGPLARALGNDAKGKVSPLIYLLAIPLSFVAARVAQSLYVLIAVLWLIPDRRIERVFEQDSVDP